MNARRSRKESGRLSPNASPSMTGMLFLMVMCAAFAIYAWYASNHVLQSINMQQEQNMKLMQQLQQKVRQSKVNRVQNAAASSAMVPKQKTLPLESSIPQEKQDHPQQLRPMLQPRSDKSQLRYDSSDATVMAMAQGYPLRVHRRFIGSLRHSGFTGTILYAVEPDMKQGVEEYLKSQNVTLLKIQYTPCDNPIYDERMEKIKGHRGKEGNTCIHPYPNIKIRWGRYPFLRDALKACEKCTGPVLVADARDTYFQRDPFGDGLPPIEGLQLYAEHYTIKADSFFVRNRVNACHNGFQMNGPMLCSGTTIANRDVMIEYLEIMYAEMIYWMTNPKCLKIKSHGGDQAIENYLYYAGKFDKLQPMINFPQNGIVNTVGVRGSDLSKWEYKRDKKFKDDDSLTTMVGVSNSSSWINGLIDDVDKDGYFVELDGSRSRVIHQFDRFGNDLVDWLTKTDRIYDNGIGDMDGAKSPKKKNKK